MREPDSCHLERSRSYSCTHTHDFMSDVRHVAVPPRSAFAAIQASSASGLVVVSLEV